MCYLHSLFLWSELTFSPLLRVGFIEDEDEKVVDFEEVMGIFFNEKIVMFQIVWFKEFMF